MAAALLDRECPYVGEWESPDPRYQGLGRITVLGWDAELEGCLAVLTESGEDHVMLAPTAPEPWMHGWTRVEPAGEEGER